MEEREWWLFIDMFKNGNCCSNNFAQTNFRAGKTHLYRGGVGEGGGWLGSKRRRYLAIPEAVGNINRGQQCCRPTFGQIFGLVE